MSIAHATPRGCGGCWRSGCRPHRRWARRSACSRWPPRCPGTLDPISSAAHQIALNMAGVAFMIPLGLGSAGAVRVGHAVGAGDRAARLGRGLDRDPARHRLHDRRRRCASCCVPRQLIGLFTTDADVLAVGTSLLLLAAVFQLFDGIQGVITGTLRGIGDTRTPMIVNLVAHWLLGLPTGYLLCFVLGWGVYGLWVGLSLGLIVTGVILFWVWTREDQALSVKARASRVTAAVINDATFISSRRASSPGSAPIVSAITGLGWEFPDSVEALGARWVAELDKHGVAEGRADREPARRCRFGRDGRGAQPVALRRLLHARSDAQGRDRLRASARSTRACARSACFRRCIATRSTTSASRACSSLPLAPRRHRRAGRGVRALRRAVGRHPQEARPAEPVRDALRQSARSARRSR